MSDTTTALVDPAATILNAGAALGNIRLVKPTDGAPVAVVPDGYKMQVIPMALVEQWAGKPDRKKGWFHFDEVNSFIRYFNEHKTDSSRIFAKITDTGAKFYGILNFHGAESSFNDHICAVALRPTHEWTEWVLNANRHMPQAAFAAFLEDNSDWFIEPRGADLLELIADLEGKAHVDITQAVKLQTGAINLKFTETIELKAGGSSSQSGDITVPKEFTVEITPFEGTRHQTMKARLRFRIQEKKIIFWYEPVDSHLVVRLLCAELLDNIENQTSVVPFKIAPSGLNANLATEDTAEED